jgi:hypothetical protein
MFMKKYIYILFLILARLLTAKANSPVREYSIEECQKLGLVSVIDENGAVVMPKDDGGFFKVANTYQTADVTPEQVANFFENARQVGSVVDDILRFESVGKLPAVIQKRINGVIYEIGLHQLVFTPNGNTLSIYAMITTADQKKICFAGEQIGFTGQGGIKEGTLRLVLGGESKLQFDKLKKIDLEITEGALKFGCNGYESFTLAGNVIFDRTLIVPDDVRTGQPLEGNVRSAFRMEDVKSWNDMLIRIDMQPFQLPNMEGYGFDVSNAIIDISDGKNAGGLAFPQGYSTSETGSLWQGVYIGNVSVRFPTSFKNRSGKFANKRIEVGVNNLLIDRYGVSGEVYGQNIFTTQEGDLNGWDYSISGASIVLVKSKVKAGSLLGEMRIAVANDKKMMQYKAIIDPTRDYYNFTVETGENLEFEFLKASEVILTSSSSIKLELIQKEFVATANLHGVLNIGSDDYGIELEKFTFQDLKVSTKAPYLSIGYFGGGSGKTYEIGNFPISFKGPEITVAQQSVFVGFGVSLTLDKMGVAAEGGFMIEGEFINENNRHYWKNKKIGLKKLAIAADFNHFAFRGQAEFFKEDPLYGKGFYGQLELGVCLNNCAYAQAAAVFGRVKGKDSYWFVDGELNLEGGNGGLNITLLAGTVYKKMKPATNVSSSIRSVSGVVYVPDYSIAWGARFGAGITIGSEGKSIGGAGGLEIVAKDGGGIESFGLMGMVSIANSSNHYDASYVRDSYHRMCGGDMSPGEMATKNPDDANSGDVKAKGEMLFPPNASGINGSIVLRFNFSERSFMGRVGFDVAKANIQFAFLGAFYFSPTKWYIHLGEPPIETRLKLKLPSLPPIFDGYFMFGHGISELPPPIPNLFDTNPSLSGERHSGISLDKGIDGSGFAFGVAASLSSAGGYKNIIAYSIGARIGLDMMAVNYGSGVTCYGFNYPIGMNGWLASGQIYAVGEVTATAFRIPLASIQLGALLKGTAPNPTSAQGQVILRFKVLAKKYDFKMGFEVGDDCRLVRTDESSEDITIFKSIYPAQGASGVDYAIEPFVQFTEDVNEKIESDELETEFRIRPISFVVKNAKGENTKGDWDVERKDKTKFFFKHKKDLEGNMDYTGIAKVQLEMKEGGSWVPLTIGGTAEKTYNFKFKTRKTPEQIEAERKEQEKRAAEEAERKRQEEIYQAELAKIRANEELQRQALAQYQAQLAAVQASTEAERARIFAAAEEAKRQLDEINRQAEERARQIEADAAHQAADIRAENERKAAELAELIRQSQASEAHKRAAEEAARAAKEAADQAVRNAEVFVQNVVNQAVAEVKNVTNHAKWEVEYVRNEATGRVEQIGNDTQNQIRNLAYEKQARLNQLNEEMKAELNGIKWWEWNKKKKRSEIRNRYYTEMYGIINNFDNRINALPAQCAAQQRQVSDEAQARMNAIVANAQARANAIMADAANKSQDAMNRARDTANAIMAEAERQCRDILGGGPAIADLNGFAQMLKDQNNYFDQAYNEDDL